MDFMETTIDIMYRLAREHSPRGIIDKYWQRILPEALDIAANEIFLALHRVYINESIKQSAFSLAQTAPPRDISKLDDGTLALHSITRQVWLGISETSEFQSLVDKNHGVIYNTAAPPFAGSNRHVSGSHTLGRLSHRSTARWLNAINNFSLPSVAMPN